MPKACCPFFSKASLNCPKVRHRSGVKKLTGTYGMLALALQSVVIGNFRPKRDAYDLFWPILLVNYRSLQTRRVTKKS